MKYDNKPCGERPINLCPPNYEPDLTGFIIVRLFAHVSETVRDLRKAKLLPGMTRFLERYPEIDTQRLISSVSPQKLLQMEKKAQASKFPPLHSLTTYWRLDYRGLDIDPCELLKTLQQLSEVDYAYLEKAVSDPAVNAANDPYARDQGYLDPAQVGIDARWAWTQPNGDGTGVGFIDLERAWNLNHEDLPTRRSALIFNDNREGVSGLRGDHGTSVLGIVGGVDNKIGIIGIAPRVDSVRVVSHYQAATNTENHVAAAIVAAIKVMDPGDVLLLEVQRDYYPTETDVADFDAIRLATAAGIIVVEAAGNRNEDLDALPAGVSFHGDSGAIMVASCESALPHNRFVGLGFRQGSNFGSRINCFAWGQNIVTTGKGDLSGLGSGTNNDDYTRTFDGTSGAAAIIAGAALVVQGMYQAVPPVGGRLSPLQMRAILSDPTTGTPQGSGTAGNIKVMPNLRAILQTKLALTPDVYLRDDVGDTGVVPSIGSLSASPDIIVRPVREANPTASFGERSGNENSNTLSSNIEAGQDNYIYVRMKNRSRTAAANDTTATVYWSPASTLVTPDRWTLIGTSAPVNVPAGDTLVVADPIVWRAADIPAAGHYCFIAILNQASDLAPAIPPERDWDDDFLRFIRNNNNVTSRNFNVINEVTDPLTLEFLVSGAPDTIRSFDLEILQRLPPDADVVLEMPLDLFTLVGPYSSLTADIDRRVARINLPHLASASIEDLQLSSRTDYRCRLVITNVGGITSGHSMAVRQIFEGQEVGRVTWFVQKTEPAPRPRRRR